MQGSGMGQLLDGKALAAEVKARLKQEVAALPVKPGLAVVLVGNDPASEIYVNSKGKACTEVGMHSEKVVLPESTTEAELLTEIDRLNRAPEIHGILIQLPVPGHIHEDKVLKAVHPDKDVDGFHPVNMGLFFGNRHADFPDLLIPCTPKGIMHLIRSTGEEIKGKRAVVIGRSNLVGKPAALLLTYANATVTLCHRNTVDLAAHCRAADILVAAVGKANLVTADMVKPGAIVIDVGVSRVDGKIVGDVDFEAVRDVAGWITPMPGGTGPMTIACLLENTLLAMQKIRRTA
jgi:methylenetetrahydrofolate dehydrogenase (NADP+)/methenyltetrahydrofolate cyclohydrolase